MMTSVDGPDASGFWAETAANRVVERIEAQTDSGGDESPIVVKGGISPSGVPHLGNVNEIMRGFFVAEALRDRGHDVRQVFTLDDRDPLRGLPRTLATLDGDLVDLGEVDAGVLGRNLGHPYTDVPDPFGCCDSYGDHFSHLIERSASQLDVPIDVVSNTELYEGGAFDDVTRRLLSNADAARDLLASHQDKVDAGYVPFNPICDQCGKLTEAVTSVDLAVGNVTYRCTDLDAGDQVIEGCGNEGEATFREGKLPWRFEWPAQWDVLGVDFEPFGKDHAEGSWPSGTEIAERLLGIEPPEPLTYEWFTLNGEPLSSSAGNVILVSDVLELVESEVLRYFFAKDPNRARNFSVERIDRLVDEFDRYERRVHGEGTDETYGGGVATVAYPWIVAPADVPDAVVPDPLTVGEFDRNDGEARSEWRDALEAAFVDRIRFPYTFAAVLGMFEERSARESFARSAGHLPEDPADWVVDDAFDRVRRARTWAERTENEYNYRLCESLPAIDFDEPTQRALDDLAELVENGASGDEIHGAVFEIARDHGLEPSDLFGAAYRLLFDRERGPRLGPFLARLDPDFVVGRLRRKE